MTTSDLVARIAADAGISQKAAGLALKSFVGAVHETLKSGEGAIRVPDLGTFKITERKERAGVNPRTREKMIIPGCKAPSFAASKALKSAVKGS
jgi:DNA-binding protein HU-beta